ncbi:Hypothetical predicted protein, partial [Paramuricea clavata]
MKVAKALCVVFLFYSASYGESRRMKNDPNSEKRTGVANTPSTIAESLRQKVLHASGESQGRQFAFIYLQPTGRAELILTDRNVDQALSRSRSLNMRTIDVFPPTPKGANFRMAFPTNPERIENHSEYKLLNNNALRDM